MRTLLTIAVTLIILSIATALPAQNLTANITNGQEPGNIMPTTSAGVPRTSSGTASFVLSPTNMTFTATVTGIDFTGTQSADVNDNLLAAHIHISDDPLFTPPTNAGVRWGFFGTPFNETAPNDQVVTPLATGVGGTISGKWDPTEGNNTTFAPWIDDILAGRAYINFHTTQFGGGEIRGAIIPEPSTIALAGFAAAGLAVFARRRRARRAA